jgi:DNA primase
VKILILPQGEDPDEVIMGDASQWQKLLMDAKPMIDFIFESQVAKVDLASARDKSTAVDRLLPLLFEMKDPLRQAHYLERLARLLRTDEHVLSDALRKFKALKKRRETAGVKSLKPVATTVISSSPLEQYCLALLLQYPELKSGSTALSPDHLENTENRELFAKWQQSNDLASLRDSLDSALQEHLDNLMARAFPSILTQNESIRRETIDDCVIRLQERRLRALESQKEELLAIEAEIGGTAAQLAKLEEQGLEISRQLQEVFIKQNHRRRQAKSDGQ